MHDRMWYSFPRNNYLTVDTAFALRRLLYTLPAANPNVCMCARACRNTTPLPGKRGFPGRAGNHIATPFVRQVLYDRYTINVAVDCAYAISRCASNRVLTPQASLLRDTHAHSICGSPPPRKYGWFTGQSAGLMEVLGCC